MTLFSETKISSLLSFALLSTKSTQPKTCCSAAERCRRQPAQELIAHNQMFLCVSFINWIHFSLHYIKKLLASAKLVELNVCDTPDAPGCCVMGAAYLQVGHSEQRQQGEGHQVEQSRLSSTVDPGGHGGRQQT